MIQFKRNPNLQQIQTFVFQEICDAKLMLGNGQWRRSSLGGLSPNASPSNPAPNVSSPDVAQIFSRKHNLKMLKSKVFFLCMFSTKMYARISTHSPILLSFLLFLCRYIPSYTPIQCLLDGYSTPILPKRSRFAPCQFMSQIQFLPMYKDKGLNSQI